VFAGTTTAAAAGDVIPALLLSTDTIIKVRMAMRMKRIMHSMNLSVIRVLLKYLTYFIDR
jgi:hypothetical protein